MKERRYFSSLCGLPGVELRYYVSFPSVYYCPNLAGNGLFFVDLSKNECKQILGTCDFSVRNCKTLEGKKNKIRKAVRIYEEN